jgi:chromate transport protein ChrA
MVVPLVAKGLLDGISDLPYVYTILKTLPWIAIIVLLKFYFGGAKNRSERLMHGKVVMVTVSMMRYEYLYVLKLTNPGREAHQALVLLSYELLHLEALKLFS